MRTWKWMFTAALLVSVSAAAQRPAATQTAPASQPSATDSQTQQSTTPAPTPSALPQPTTMVEVPLTPVNDKDERPEPSQAVRSAASV